MCTHPETSQVVKKPLDISIMHNGENEATKRFPKLENQPGTHPAESQSHLNLWTRIRTQLARSNHH
jgi:hypothetical protein